MRKSLLAALVTGCLLFCSTRATAQETAMNLQPEEVFTHFAAVSAIPRSSGHEEAIGAYLLEFARALGLEADLDAAGNLLVRKPAGPGGENAAPLVIQAHMDMVWASDDDSPPRPIRLVRDGDWLRADGTSLGSDNGIGLAYSMAILKATDLPHPPLEVVVTVSEETGMQGALQFDMSRLVGDRILNIDSEEEGILYAGCSGGETATLSLRPEYVAVAELPGASELAAYSIEIAGLRGGHSGVEIDKDRGNAHRLLGRVLSDVGASWPFYLASVEGGRVDNAIPDRSQAVALWRGRDEAALRARLDEWQAVLSRELAGPDAGVTVTMRPATLPQKVIGMGAQAKIVTAMMVLPHGPVSMERLIPGQDLVETSTNLAVIRTEADRISLTVSMRSSLDSKLAFVTKQVQMLAKLLGMECAMSAAYPGWAFEPESTVRDAIQQALVESGAGEAKVMGVHGGLECGVFAKNYATVGRKADLASIGPDIIEAHTTEERLGIPSAQRTWAVLKRTLEILCTR